MSCLFRAPAFACVELDFESDAGSRIFPLAVYALIFISVPSRLRLDLIIASLGQLALSQVDTVCVVIKI